MIYDLIEKKKHGEALSRDEINQMISSYVAGRIPDYQMSALLMAIWFNGMTDAETTALTLAMAYSGATMDLSQINGIKVDKHSTGGVGDKTTLICGPVAAACHVPVAKLVGRSLGHTGGTLDKLSSIPGMRCDLPMENFIAQVKAIGLCIMGQTADLVPADRMLYALRDATCTVDSLPLIAASVMSKKLAAGADAIILDVKTGSGAFMQNKDDAKKLAQTMVDIAKNANRNAIALVTDMSVPLGNCIGNALEVKEAVEVLKGGGPSDLVEVSLRLSAEMILAGGRAETAEEAVKKAVDAIKSGAALCKFKDMINAQGGDADAAVSGAGMPHATHEYILTAPQEGYIFQMDTHGIGTASMLSGAGRATKEDEIDYSAGIRLLKKTGDYVQKNMPIAVIYTSDKNAIPAAAQKLRESYTISGKKPRKKEKIIAIIRQDA